MIQSTRSGKKKIVTPLSIDPMWSGNLAEYFQRYKNSASMPREKLCKPQNYEVIYAAVSASEDLRIRGVTDDAQRLLSQLGPHVIKSVYYGFLVGSELDMESMLRPASPETVKYNGHIVSAVHLLAAHLIANALLECLNKVANLHMRSAVRTMLRRFVASSGGVLHNYSIVINECLKNRDTVYMNRGYATEGYEVFYVHPEKYDDLVIEIQPATLMESDKAEMAIRKLTSKLGSKTIPNELVPTNPCTRYKPTEHRAA